MDKTIRDEENRKEGRFFFESERKHHNPVTGLYYACVNKSVISYNAINEKHPSTGLSGVMV